MSEYDDDYVERLEAVMEAAKAKPIRNHWNAAFCNTEEVKELLAAHQELLKALKPFEDVWTIE